MNIRYTVTDDRGHEIKTGCDIGKLQKEIADRVQQTSLDTYRRQWERDALTGWNFSTLPENIALAGKHGVTGYAYPALQVTDGVVNLRLFTHPAEAAASHIEGVSALYKNLFAEKLKQLKKYIALGGELKTWAMNIGNPKQIEESIMNRVRKELFCRFWRSAEEFQKHADVISTQILPCGQQILVSITPVLKSAAETCDALQRMMQKNSTNAPVFKFLKETQAEMQTLLPVHFPELYSNNHLANIPRYLKALSIRAERGSLNLAATEAKLKDVAVYVAQYKEIQNGLTVESSAEKKNKIEELHWMIEEYKVSLFAQELRTPYPVSPKRLRHLMEEINNIIY